MRLSIAALQRFTYHPKSVEIRLRRELIADPMFGLQQRFDQQRLYVDEAQQLLSALQQARSRALSVAGECAD